MAVCFCCVQYFILIASIPAVYLFNLSRIHPFCIHEVDGRETDAAVRRRFVTALVFFSPVQPRLCHSRTSSDFGWNTSGRSQHQFHQQPVLRLHNHSPGWKVRSLFFILTHTRARTLTHTQTRDANKECH